MKKISIITPTHQTKYLKELEKTILRNTYQLWEWIILLNNGAEYESTDPRIRVIRCEKETTSVGELKKIACSHATGEILLEADHDDLLTPNCLFEVSYAFKDPEIGFVYSDDAKLSDNFIPYDPFYGWTFKHFEWEGKKLISMNAQPLTPGRLGYIWFAPDHVRAWRKSVYDQIGGHNPELDICDDQELMIRTYLATKFKHIDKVLYIYRIDGGNTWLQRSERIQQKTVEIYHQYIYRLAERFAEVNGLLKIDLCGGFNKPEGYLSIDRFGGDITADLDNGIPLPDNSVGVLRAHDAIEHLQNKMLTMKEVHRVLAPGGIFLSQTPSTDGRGAWQDPTHVSFWNENSFWYYTRPEQMQYIRNENIRFFESSLRTHFPTEWHRQNNIPYVEAFLEKM